HRLLRGERNQAGPHDRAILEIDFALASLRQESLRFLFRVQTSEAGTINLLPANLDRLSNDLKGHFNPGLTMKHRVQDLVTAYDLPQRLPQSRAIDWSLQKNRALRFVSSAPGPLLLRPGSLLLRRQPESCNGLLWHYRAHLSSAAVRYCLQPTAILTMHGARTPIQRCAINRYLQLCAA